MSLITYQEVRPWAQAIKNKTTRREMPPWFLDKNVGIQRFLDDISLSDREIATIAGWADGGAPQGNPADMPPPRTFTDASTWSIGAPDIIVSSPPHTVKAVSGDFHSPYVGNANTGLTEDRWVAAYELREVWAGEKVRSGSVVHHALISAAPPDAFNVAATQATSVRDGGFSYTYEVGHNAQLVPGEVGVLLKAGEAIHFNTIHLHSIGKEVQVRLELGIKLHPKGYKPKYLLRTGMPSTPSSGLGSELDIPGNTDDVRFDRYLTLTVPTRMTSFEPHMHSTGKRMCVEAIYPTGIIETLNCAGFDHAWVKTYQYAEDVAPLLPRGTILHVIAWYDNTPKNRRAGGDTRNWRGLGHRSIDEMLILFGKFVALTDDQFAEEVAARAATQQQPKVAASR